MKFLDYRVSVTRDSDTGQLVAQIPSLGIADYGKDLVDALSNLDEMLRFHRKASRSCRLNPYGRVK